jgi:CspA family cold shock protein
MEGTVKFFDSVKGFGFIIGTDDEEYFVHKSAIESGTSLDEDDEVTFTPTEGDRGPKAEDVSKVDGDTSADFSDLE